MALNDPQIAGYAYAAGWRGKDLVVAIAVCLAESGGDPNAHATKGEDSRGLWQINVSSTANPEYGSADLYDPGTNAQIAHQIWATHGWGPWSTHNNGAYLLYMPRATAVAAIASTVVPGASAVSGAVGAVTAPLDAAKSLATEGIAVIHWLEQPNSWVRMLKITLAILLIGGGLYIVAETPIWRDAGKALGAVGGGTAGTVKKAARGAKAAAAEGSSS